MKKALKIIGITLGSLVALVLVVVFIACYLVFTPKRLTPIVNQVADSLLICPHTLDEVNLTFFRTFPNFGVEVQGLYIINPMEGAQSDTVLAIPDLVVGVDIMKAIDGDIMIKKCALQDIEANIYIDSLGNNNFTVWNPDLMSEDTLAEDTLAEDTTTSVWQLRSIAWEEAIRFSARKLSFVDKKDSLAAGLTDCCIQLSGTDTDSLAVKLDLDANHVSFQMKGEQYADDLHLRLTLPMSFQSSEHITIDGTQIAIEEYTINLDGYVGSPCFASGIYNMDVTVKTNEWKISNVWHLVPPSYQSLWPKEVDADGHLQLIAHAVGTYDSISLPLVDAQILLTGAQGRYTPLPYYFDEVEADITAHADLNNKNNTTATLNRVFARTGKTSVTVSGTATDILKNTSAFELSNPLCNLKADMNIYLPDANYWIKSDSVQSWVKGTMKGTITAQTRLNDVTNFNLNKMKVNGNLTLNNVDVMWQDSTLAQVQGMTVQLTAPKKNITDKNILSADCKIGLDNLHAQLLTADLDAVCLGGTLNAAIEIDTKDTTNIPTITGGFDLTDLVADMDTIHAHAVAPKGQVTLTSSRRSKQKPKMIVSFSASEMQAMMGKTTQAKTGNITIEATATYNKDADKVLLKWNPRLKFDLQDGHAELAQLSVPVDIPAIKFAYSNREFKIDTSRIVLGHSDFSLSGDVRGIGKWLGEQGELEGDLRFTSDVTDVNEIIDILNNFNKESGAVQTDEVEQPAQATSSSPQTRDPFMVPERVNLNLLTTIKKAYVFDETLQNLGGKLYLKDGTAILEEIGFVCEAAKLQLTAMYRTPRRDHIYVGLDYHMIDIDLQQLISMIPQLDTLVPMLSSFKGGAQFHIAAETYVNDQYQLKPSTIRGACSIEGNDLVLLDNETFSTIAKILMFKKKTENKVDSISVQIGLYKDEITVYPFCLSIDNYMAAVGGNHYLDMNFNYHASLLKPFYIGVDVSGNLDDLHIKPGKCRYVQDFRPIINKDTETKAAELKKIISNSLKQNVKIQ